jgi:VanZ family protein
MRFFSPPLSGRALLWLPPVFYMLAIFHFSSESDPLPELTPHVWDKLLHTIEYAGLGFLLYRAFLGEGIGRARALALTIVIVAMYGASDEWHQSFVPRRTADLHDWLVDTVGGGVGAFGYRIVSRSRS